MVLILDMKVGCLLVEFIIGVDVWVLCECNFGVLIIIYVNMFVDVKVECDICCIFFNVL